MLLDRAGTDLILDFAAENRLSARTPGAPASLRPCRKAPTCCADSPGDLALRNPITGIAGCLEMPNKTAFFAWLGT
jgi:hypothetical protein